MKLHITITFTTDDSQLFERLRTFLTGAGLAFRWSALDLDSKLLTSGSEAAKEAR